MGCKETKSNYNKKAKNFISCVLQLAGFMGLDVFVVSGDMAGVINSGNRKITELINAYYGNVGKIDEERRKEEMFHCCTEGN